MSSIPRLIQNADLQGSAPLFEEDSGELGVKKGTQLRSNAAGLDAKERFFVLYSARTFTLLPTGVAHNYLHIDISWSWDDIERQKIPAAKQILVSVTVLCMIRHQVSISPEAAHAPGVLFN